MECLHTVIVRNNGTNGVQIVPQLSSIATWLNVENKKPWLILYGGIGNGKTTMARTIRDTYDNIQTQAKEKLKNLYLLSAEDRRINDRLAALPTPEIISAVEIATLAASDPESYAKVKRKPILIIDDMGIEALKVMHYGTEINPVAELLYHRYDQRMLTIITTNKDLQQLCSDYGERLADRFKEVAARIGFTAKSYR